MLHFILLRSFVQIYQYSISPNAFQRLQNRLNQKGSSPTKNDLTFFVLKIVSNDIILIQLKSCLHLSSSFIIKPT